MTESQKYAVHLDILRQQNKMTVEQFCSDIVDERTFRRYKTGEKTISYTKIAAFCDRLKIHPSDFFYSAKTNDQNEYKRINHLYTLMRRRDFEGFKKEVHTVDKEYIFDIQNRRFFDLTLAYVAFELKEKSLDELYITFSELADYPKCLTHQSFDFVSIGALLKIAEIEIKQKKESALNLLMDILSNSDMIFASYINLKVIPTLYADVCIFLLRLHRFKAANYVAQNGINYALRNSDYTVLSYLYYTKAYALLMLNDLENAELNAARCLASIISKQADEEIELFYRVLKKDFKVDPYTFVTKFFPDLLNQTKK